MHVKHDSRLARRLIENLLLASREGFSCQISVICRELEASRYADHRVEVSAIVARNKNE
jgi:ribosomal protein L18E